MSALKTSNMMGIRLAKESKKVFDTEGMELNIVDESNNIWHITFAMAEGTVYAGECYTL